MSTLSPLLLGGALLFACSLSLANTEATDRQDASPLNFSKGTISTVVDGILPSKQQDTSYQFEGKKGQYVVINISAKPGINEIANVGVLKFPSGGQDGTKGGIVYQDCLPETGTYQLRIARNLMATHGGMAGYRAEIIMLPNYASKALCSAKNLSAE